MSIASRYLPGSFKIDFFLDIGGLIQAASGNLGAVGMLLTNRHGIKLTFFGKQSIFGEKSFSCLKLPIRANRLNRSGLSAVNWSEKVEFLLCF